jgi:hypothetical protein
VAAVVCRAPASKIFSRALRSFVSRAPRSFVVCEPHSFCAWLGSLGCKEDMGKMWENVLMTVAPPSRASSASPKLVGHPGRAIGVSLVELYHEGIIVVEVAGRGQLRSSGP